MVRYTKESIQSLRDKTDIVDIIGKYVPLKRAGASFKGCCPFHEEKTPSFTVHQSSGHYHCFGCGAHGDAISFLMQYERLEFQQAVEYLAERSGVALVMQEALSPHQQEEEKLRGRLKTCNEEAMRFFHSTLLSSPHAEEARAYLANRRIGDDFIKAFSVGYTGKQGELLSYLHSKGYTTREIGEAGLLSKTSGREFFYDRILFPILDSRGMVIGFSGRKFLESTGGGKYINTPETLLFKKSRVFFGLFYSKRRMSKERIAVLVEGQIDALQLIHAGYQMTVATLGTAFGASHVDILRAIGVEQVYIAFDQDEAGRQSAAKAGQLLMTKGVDARIIRLNGAKDPDELLQKQGAYAFFESLMASVGFVDFLVDEAKRASKNPSPAEKQKQIESMRERIYEWENPIMVHEAIKVLSRLTDVPEELLRKGKSELVAEEKRPIQKEGSEKKKQQEDVLEQELVRHLFFSLDKLPQMQDLIRKGFGKEELSSHLYQKIFQSFFSLLDQRKPLLLGNLIDLFDVEELETCRSLLSENKLPPEKAALALLELINKIKERNWRQKREVIRDEIQKAQTYNMEEALRLTKELSLLGAQPPRLAL